MITQTPKSGYFGVDPLSRPSTHGRMRMTKSNIAKIIDRLGELKAEIAVKEEEAESLITELKGLGVGSYVGSLWEASVFTQERSRTDWEKVVERCKIKESTIARYTTSKPVTVCKLTARQTA